MTIIMARNTGQSKWFGFLELAIRQEAGSAITKMNGSEMDARTLKVSEARAKVPGRGSGPGRGHIGSFRR